MAYDPALADRLRDLLHTHHAVEKAMFGGLAFMVQGHMTVGVIGEELVARVGKENADEALALPHARPMDFTGRPMKGWIYVAPAGVEDDAALAAWVRRCLAWVKTQPPK